MILVWLILGLVLPTLAGWLLVRLMEWRATVLFPLERIVMGLVLGLTLTMFVATFASTWLHVPLTLVGFLGIQLALTATLGALWFVLRQRLATGESVVLPPPVTRMKPLVMLTLGILLLWTAVKIAAGGFVLVSTPAYLDDTVDNWNFRGKIIYTEKAYTPHVDILSQIASYPPTVPLAKVWFATLAGEWNEGAVNAIHIVWFLAALVLVFFALRRTTGAVTALVGAYALASLPLYMIQGTNPYAEVFESVHILIAVSLLLHALHAQSAASRLAFLRLSAVATALLTFTKNEGFALHMPAIVLVLLAILAWLWKEKTLSRREAFHIVLWWICSIAIIAAPWVLFKVANGLTFGNAKSLTGLEIAWQPLAAISMFINTFFEGNWLLLFPIIIALLLWRWHRAFFSPLLVLTGFVLIVMTVQCSLFLFTALSTEAIYQTGFARGFTQLMPLLVMLSMLLIEDVIKRETDE